MDHRHRHRPREVVAELQLIPGHPATAAEVWLWHGPPPEIDDALPTGEGPGASADGLPRVVLRADDWPMPADAARKLAAALVAAAERAETAAHPQGRGPRPPGGRRRERAEQPRRPRLSLGGLAGATADAALGGLAGVDESLRAGAEGVISAPICCAPVAAAPMDADAALEVALRLKALADPVRVQLMSLLLTRDEVCTCDLAPAVGLTEATVSHHLSVLKKAGLITDGERRGMNVFYRARRDALGALGRVLDPDCC